MPWLVRAVVIGIIVGVAIQWPMPAVLLVATSVVALGLFVAPRGAMAALAVFLVLQTPIVNLVGGREVALGLALQRLDEAIAAAAAIRVAVLMTWNPIGRRLRPWLLYASGFGAAGALSAVLAGVPPTTWILGAFLSLKFLLFLLLALSVDWSRADAERIVRLAFVLGPVLLVMGFLAWILPDRFEQVFASREPGPEGFFLRGGIQSMHAPFVHPGLFGWAMAVTGCYAAVALLIGGHAKRGGLGLTASIIGILASLRRKPLIGLPIAVLSVVVRHGSARRRWTLLAVLAVLALGVGLFARSQIDAVVEDTVSSYLDPYAPTTARVLLYATGFAIGREHFPFGAGFGRFGGFVSELHYSPLYDEYGLSGVYGLSRTAPYYMQDTYWPHVLGEAGVLGIIMLIGLFLHLWLRVGRVARTAADRNTKILAMGAAAVLVEGLVESVAGPILEVSLQTYVIAVPLGIALAISVRSTAATTKGLDLDLQPVGAAPPHPQLPKGARGGQREPSP